MVLTQVQIDQIIELYATENLGFNDIESQLNLSRIVVKRILTESGVEIRKVGRVFNGGKSVANKKYKDKHKAYCKAVNKEWRSNNQDKLNSAQKRWRDKKMLLKLSTLTDLTFDQIAIYVNMQKIINTPLSDTDVILSKAYLEDFKTKYGVEEMKLQIPNVVSFIRKYHPKFPYPNPTSSLREISDKIRNYDYTTIYKDEKSFKNATSPVGNEYLKHLFKSYWGSHYEGNLSPLECWSDDKELGRIIAWRIGINNSNEVYNLSPKIILRGMSAARQTISFFKPLVAAAIYRHYNITNKQNLVVFDPCAGFGGRMLGFKSLYPDGTYIALEPNKTTFSNLMTLGGDLGGCELYETTVEDFSEPIEYDFAFTSIPYFDLEYYQGEKTSYKDFDDWKNTFIAKLLTYPRLIVNMSVDICDKLGLNQYIDTYLVSPSSHFAKTREPKREVIIKVNF